MSSRVHGTLFVIFALGVLHFHSFSALVVSDRSTTCLIYRKYLGTLSTIILFGDCTPVTTPLPHCIVHYVFGGFIQTYALIWIVVIFWQCSSQMPPLVCENWFLWNHLFHLSNCGCHIASMGDIPSLTVMAFTGRWFLTTIPFPPGLYAGP